MSIISCDFLVELVCDRCALTWDATQPIGILKALKINIFSKVEAQAVKSENLLFHGNTPNENISFGNWHLWQCVCKKSKRN